MSCPTASPEPDDNMGIKIVAFFVALALIILAIALFSSCNVLPLLVEDAAELVAAVEEVESMID